MGFIDYILKCISIVCKYSLKMSDYLLANSNLQDTDKTLKLITDPDDRRKVSCELDITWN